MSTRTQLLRSAATGILLAYTAHSQAFAQAQPAAAVPAKVSEVTEVLVTGSRISNPNLASPTPVTSIGELDLQRQSPKLFDALTTMPQFRASPSNKGFIGLATQSGGARLNLRNFGPQRTLVLVDGMRVPVSDDRGSVDVSLIPEQLIRRVDIVTGGASAAYGSDAVAGAVNFILDTGFRGTKAEASYGVSTYGDGDAVELSASHGLSFADGRGSLIVSGDYYHQQAIGPFNNKRDWYNSNAGVVINTAGAQPTQLVFNHGLNNLVPTGGLITSGPLSGTTFDAGGLPRPEVFGSPRDSIIMVGGEGAGRIPGGLIGSLKRGNFFLHSEFQASPNVTLFGEAAYADSHIQNLLQQSKTWSGNAPTIFSDNAYITPQLASQMLSAGVTSFRMARTFNDLPIITSDGDDKTYRVLGGVRGEFAPEWKYQAYAQYSQSKVTATYLNSLQFKNFSAAVDAVRDPATGQIVCRSTLAGLTPGCVPINLFGAGSVSPAGEAYIKGTQQVRTLTIDEWNYGANTQRPLFKLWADEPAILVVGYEGRSQKVNQATALPAGFADFTGIRGVPAGRITSSQFEVGGFFPYSGSVKVNEGFAELNIPVIKDKPLINALSVDAAIRYTKYDPSGPATTYKVGVIYEPIPDIRLRGSYSKDIRAPALFDMFQASSPISQTNIVTPFGIISQTSFGVGNPHLKPESAKTYTIGAVLQPSSIPRLTASIDYYHISLEQGIGAPG
ncbi:MAG: iron complex outerrane recepter protein, partial [Mucilaginibacter sp.]|nr:iron complex outerrane recepter protein [Mucilaginibacter sp.]